MSEQVSPLPSATKQPAPPKQPTQPPSQPNPVPSQVSSLTSSEGLVYGFRHVGLSGSMLQEQLFDEPESYVLHDQRASLLAGIQDGSSSYLAAPPSSYPMIRAPNAGSSGESSAESRSVVARATHAQRKAGSGGSFSFFSSHKSIGSSQSTLDNPTSSTSTPIKMKSHTRQGFSFSRRFPNDSNITVSVPTSNADLTHPLMSQLPAPPELLASTGAAGVSPLPSEVPGAATSLEMSQGPGPVPFNGPMDLSADAAWHHAIAKSPEGAAQCMAMEQPGESAACRARRNKKWILTVKVAVVLAVILLIIVAVILGICLGSTCTR